MKPPGHARISSTWRAAVEAAALVAAATTLQGCTVPHVDGYLDISDENIATHRVPFWRQKQDYWELSSYQDPVTQLPAFNSCMDTRLSALEVCSRRGHCAPFDESDITHPIYFCKCVEAWGGPECNIQRKSQLVAWLLSLLLGPSAADELYLGYQKEAMAKVLITVTGLALSSTGSLQTGILVVFVPWLFDVVRIGMAPVQAQNFRLAADLPRWNFAVFTVLYFAFVAFSLGVASMYYLVLKRRRLWDQSRLYDSGVKVIS